jgi:hypothetical protein
MKQAVSDENTVVQALSEEATGEEACVGGTSFKDVPRPDSDQEVLQTR